MACGQSVPLAQLLWECRADAFLMSLSKVLNNQEPRALGSRWWIWVVISGQKTDLALRCT